MTKKKFKYYFIHYQKLIFKGVVKLTGDMLKEYFPKVKTNLVMIGIAPWGLISERNLLIGSGVS